MNLNIDLFKEILDKWLALQSLNTTLMVRVLDPRSKTVSGILPIKLKMPLLSIKLPLLSQEFLQVTEVIRLQLPNSTTTMVSCKCHHQLMPGDLQSTQIDKWLRTQFSNITLMETVLDLRRKILLRISLVKLPHLSNSTNKLLISQVSTLTTKRMELQKPNTSTMMLP